MKNFGSVEKYQTSILMGINLVLNLVAQISPIFFLSDDFLDLFNGAITLPNFIRVIIYTIVSAIYIRYFSANVINKLNYCKNLIVIYGGFLILLSVFCIYFADEINKILLPGFSFEQRSILNESFIILMTLPLFFGINSILRAYLYADERFQRVEFIEISGSLLTILVYILNWDHLSLKIAALGVLAGAFTQSLLMLFSVKIHSSSFSFDLSPIKWYFHHGKMLFASNVYYKTDPIVDKNLLSRAPIGDLSAQGYAMMLATGCSTFISKIFSSTIIKVLTDFHISNDFKSLRYFYKKRLLLIFLFSLFFYILSSFILKNFIELYFIKYGANNSLLKISEYYNLLFFVLIFGAIGSLSSNALYSINLSKTASINGVIIYTIFVLVKIISFNYYGIYGLIYSANFYYLSTAVVNGIFFLKITKDSINNDR